MAEKNSSNSDYGFFSRLLHRIALGHRFIAETTFDIEQSVNAPPKNWTTKKPVFITGLARSGTTALLQSLYDTGQFSSLTYKDMPFVLMPALWKKISNISNQKFQAKERAHGDGVLVDPQSPEAFEEVFWRIYCSGDYIHSDHLSAHKITGEVIRKFRSFVSSIVRGSGRPGAQRYLSKNNNNILRLNAIQKAFPDALIIIPYRNPLQQAISLMNQHQLFCQRHKADQFSLDYMNWLGHHEFGLGHKPFKFELAQGNSPEAVPDNINYWLGLWKYTYLHILETAPTNCYFLSYEQLCDNSKNVAEEVYNFALIPDSDRAPGPAFKQASVKNTENIAPDLLQDCDDVYRQLLARNQQER